LSIKRLEELQVDKKALAKKFEFANYSVQDYERKAQKARDLYQDAGLDLWKAESDIQVVNREMIEVRRHMEAVEDQIRMIKDGGGVVLWPKPCLHPDLLEEVGGAIDLGGQSRLGYHLLDILIR
jgi:hypothetical protein